MTEFHAVVIQFQQAEYPRSLVRVHVTANTDLEGESISAIPDLTLVFSTLTNPKLRRNPFILETAFAQSSTSVFKKVKGLIAARPEVLVVVVVLIDEKSPYHTPMEGSSAWERFKRDPQLLELEAFIDIADDPQQVVPEDFMSPIVVAGHTWSSIKRVSYYVWLKKPADSGASDDSGIRIEIDPEEVEQTEFTAHGVCLFPKTDTTTICLTNSRYSQANRQTWNT